MRDIADSLYRQHSAHVCFLRPLTEVIPQGPLTSGLIPRLSSISHNAPLLCHLIKIRSAQSQHYLHLGPDYSLSTILCIVGCSAAPLVSISLDASRTLQVAVTQKYLQTWLSVPWRRGSKTVPRLRTTDLKEI